MVYIQKQIKIIDNPVILRKQMSAMAASWAKCFIHELSL